MDKTTLESIRVSDSLTINYWQAIGTAWTSIKLGQKSFIKLIRLAQRGVKASELSEQFRCAKSKVDCIRCTEQWSCPAYRYRALQRSRNLRIQVDSYRREVYAHSFALDNISKNHKFFSLLDSKTNNNIGGFSLNMNHIEDLFKIRFNSSMRLVYQG